MGKEPQYAHHPLNLLSNMFHSAGVVTGWFVEGLLDLQKVDHALGRLVVRWRMLAGRLERTGVCLLIILLEGSDIYLGVPTCRRSTVLESEFSCVHFHPHTFCILSP
jgi:hypothetical protein